MLERSVERMLRDGIKVRVPKARCLKFVTPGFTGVPDRIILLPGAETVFRDKWNGSGSYSFRLGCGSWALRCFLR